MSSGRAQGSPSFMKSVFGTGWGKRAPGIGPQGQSISVDPRYSIDPGIFGPIVQGAKQVRQKYKITAIHKITIMYPCDTLFDKC